MKSGRLLRHAAIAATILVCATIAGAQQPPGAERARSAPEKTDERATTASCPNPNALGTSRVIALGAVGGVQIGLKSYPQTLDLADHEVVLTFDDGPAPGATEQVLDALKAECVRATFFLIGRNAQAHPELVRREIAEGHTVGHHSMTHPARTLRGISESAAIDEIRRGMAADDIAAYGAASATGAPRVPFFRFPGFADSKASLAWLGAHNIATFGTDIWASDWNQLTPEAQLALVMQRVETEGRGVILFHDTRKQTSSMLHAFLQRLKQRGFRVAHVVPGADERPLRPAKPGWSSETEAILARVMPRLLKIRDPGAPRPGQVEHGEDRAPALNDEMPATETTQ
jgi:peptidoglycan/xylan/chitin deacetylase (PgdA/CDA1 family)